MATLLDIGNWIKVALGLGFVIFVHELGHFLLAKWNGVKVERFSIGFGPTLASWRKGVGLRIGTGSRPPGPGDPPTYGETEYVLAALPLGGYVLMLGEDPEASTEASTDGSAPRVDPRSFANKSVWARMQIITAGVIMNILLAIACFTCVFMVGGEATPANIGTVLPGRPAYRAGLQAGDVIVAIDGRRDVIYKDLRNRVSFSAAGQKIRFTVRRPGVDREIDLDIEPSRDAGAKAPTIGVLPEFSLELLPERSFRAMPGQAVDPSKPNGGFEGEVKVVAVGPEGGELAPVADERDYLRKLDALRAGPMVVEVERTGPKDKDKDKPDGQPAAKIRQRVTVAPHPLLELGFRLTPGLVEAVRPGSPAEKAGIKPGDRIVAVGGDRDFDPMALPDLARESAGRPLALTVERAGSGSGVGKEVATVEVSATPDDSPTWTELAEMVDPDGSAMPLGVPGLGLTLAIEPKVAAVAANSPAARAGIKPGDALRALILTPEPPEAGKSESKSKPKKPKPIEIKLEGDFGGWVIGSMKLQQVSYAKVELAVKGSDKPVEVKPEFARDRFHPRRGLLFLGLSRPMPPLGLLPALRRGCEETLEDAYNTLLIPQRMIQSRIGGDAVGGVIPIFQIAHESVVNGWLSMIQFFAALSVGLAVLNSLPIPPLDGGQFVFLVAEKVRGRPLPEPILNFFKIGGLIFVLGLIIVINGRDIWNLVAGKLLGE